jgi:hypothetical protein
MCHTTAYNDGFKEYNADDEAGILRIPGATGWTVWAASQDQQIKHVSKARGDSIDVSYPYLGMDRIWLSDSHSSV